MPETTPLIKAALNLRVGAGFDVYRISLAHSDSQKIKENGNAYQPEEKTVKENRCCMVCWIPCSSGLCCGYYFIRFLNIRR